ncbi:MAG: Smr/MutS family protein [Chitinophagaceae bacterium]|nr:Smr/MutS family protein [Chitinophagaceae bacterium]
MKYQVGDKILVLHSNEEGEVVELMNEQMVMIDVDGVRFPVYMDQIDFPYFKRFTDKKLFAHGVPISEKKKEKKYIDDVRKEKATAKYKVTNGVWLSFLPVFDKDVFDDDVVEDFKLYLINQTPDPLRFTYHLKFAGKPGFELKNEVFSLSDFYLHDVLFEDMNDAPKFEFEFSLINANKKKTEYFEASLKLKAKQLFQKIEEMKVKNEPTFSYRLFEEYPDKIIDDKPDLDNLYAAGYKVYDGSKIKQQLEPPRSVVDLHIEKLTNEWKHLTNFEILTLQLKAFEKYYYLATAHHQPNLIVIHGVGIGKLKDEIHEILKTKKEVKTFVNQYHPNFGYGATEIYLQY